MINPTIQRQHLIRAIERLQRNGWRNNSWKFDLLWKGKRYPPKEVIREAADVAGVDLEPFGGGLRAIHSLRSAGSSS